MVKKKELRSFAHRDILFVFLVIFSLAGSFVFLREVALPLGLEGISGYDVAEIQATCGGATACQCGDELTTSRTLTATDNLTGCFSNAVLTINASHVILDCNKFTLAGNGTTPVNGIIVGGTYENITIRNCVLDNMTADAIRLSAGGNHSLIQNNNITRLNSSAISRGVMINNNVMNVTIEDNRFNGSVSTSSFGVQVAGAINITIRNNTFDAVSTAIRMGNVNILVANLSIQRNQYLNPNIGIELLAAKYGAIVVRDEVTSAKNSAYILGQWDGNYSIVFVNTSMRLASSRTISFPQGNTTFTLMENESFNYSLVTHVDQQRNLSRDVFLWSARNISIQDSLSSANTWVNYTLATNFSSSGGIYVFVNGNLNASKPFNPFGRASQKMNIGTDRVNLTFTIDVVSPTLSINSPVLDSVLSVGTIETLLNVSTSENASCRYDTSNVVYASMANAFNSSSNLTHVVVVRPLSNGGSYTYYVSCVDLVNLSVSNTLNFSVGSVSSSSSSAVTAEGKRGASSKSIEEEEEDTVSFAPEVEEEKEDVIEEQSLDRVVEQKESDVEVLSLQGVEEETEKSEEYAPFFSPVNVSSLLLWGLILLVLIFCLFFYEFFYRKKISSDGKGLSSFQSARDNYSSFVLLEQKYSLGSDSEKKAVMSSLESLRDVFMRSWLETSTRILYKEGNVVLLENSSASVDIVLPPYNGVSLSSLQKDPVALVYLQALFGTKDSFAKISSVLEFISGRKAEHILLVSPSFDARKKYSQRVVGFDYSNGFFRVSASGLKK